ncbi:MAG TPA: type III-A CRISPR-associated protein Cas10/Csm1 [Fibrobacteria bacterium]|nr:type III-A CRISPR-associated protein Cas10/Csm1 [Fibrobacteria bacterium]
MGLNRLDGSARVTLAALLHDLGKLAERARVPELCQNRERLARQEQLVCPEAWVNGKPSGRSTHKHAAWTGLAFDFLERQGLLPDSIGKETWPFAQGEVDDSMANAAAMHHRPSTFLQWIVATADRIASGFERRAFDDYNQSEDHNHYSARLRVPFESVRLDEASRTWTQAYPLDALSAGALFPRAIKDVEARSNEAAQGEYLRLWEALVDGLRKIPALHRSSLSLWIDHFESLWLSVAQAIPSATAFGTLPDVSLYDHSRTAACLATALWRYHADQGHEETECVKGLSRREGAHGWQESKFLLIQGDFFGIQDFVFAEGAQTQRHGAKILRGRSFSVSLLCELACLRLLEALELPGSSQILNAAGKFLVVAPNTQEVREALDVVRREIEEWFLAKTYGKAGIGLAWCEASPEDFVPSRFRSLLQSLFASLEESKLQRFALTVTSHGAVFEAYLDAFVHDRPCAYTGLLPGEATNREGLSVSRLALDQVRMGEQLVKSERILVTQGIRLPGSLELDYFGYSVGFAPSEEASGKYGPWASEGVLRRCWDVSLPKSVQDPLWNGYARRWVAGHVPRWEGAIPEEWEQGKYKGCEEKGEFGEIKTFEHLACESRTLPAEGGSWRGQRALGILKGDVDNLGTIFQKGMQNPTFARWAGLSRQLHFFFAVHLPALCREDARFHDIYTVFAGGDDFFLVGPWKAILELAGKLRQDFAKFIVHPGISFSCGIAMGKPGMPLRQLAGLAEDALEQAKAFPGKNAVTAFGRTVPWADYLALLHEAEEMKERFAGFSTGFVYDLLQISDMADRHSKDGQPEDGLWASRLAYRAQRALPKREQTDQLQELLEHLIHSPDTGIRRFKGDYRIALSTHLYQQRDA